MLRPTLQGKQRQGSVKHANRLYAIAMHGFFIAFPRQQIHVQLLLPILSASFL